MFWRKPRTRRRSTEWNTGMKMSHNIQSVKTFIRFLALTATASLSLTALAQSYSIDWYKIAGGGGTSTGATYQVTGTIGQPDAGGAMTGGGYSVTGGFWLLISVVQTAGLPNLVI